MSNYLQQVREQYENYPYPPRDPQIENSQLQYAHQCALDVISYYHYAAKPHFLKDFRVLIAGGGTGDVTIMIAEQLRDTACEIVYVDISTASMDVAKARAKMRGLNNITWIQGSLLDVAKLTSGKFDYIDCSGVLHHLANPEAGLAALASIMQDDGVLSLMVYARYGREMIYRSQRLMRLLNDNEPDMQKRVDTCKAALSFMPGNIGAYGEIKRYGDNGIYDMLLHSHDVAYSIPELHRFMASAELEISHLFFNNDPRGNDLYRPESYVTDGRMHTLLAPLSEPDRQAVAEILHGSIAKHTFYAVRKDKRPAIPSINDLGMVPYLGMIIGDHPAIYQKFYGMFDNNKIGDTMAVKMWGLELQFIRNRNAQCFFKYLDGRRTLAEIFEAVRNDSDTEENGPSVESLHEEFKVIYQRFNRLDMMLLKTPASAPPRRSIGKIILDSGANDKKA